MSQKIVFKKRSKPSESKEEKQDDAILGGYDVQAGKPAEERVKQKKSKKESRPMLSFNEDEEDE